MTGQPVPRRHSRRAVLGGAALLAAGATGGAALLLFRGGNGSPAAPDATTTPTASPAPAGTPNQPPYASVRFTSGAFESRAFAPGELIDWSSGAFVMDVRDGSVTGWRAAAEPTDPGGAFLQGQGRFVVRRSGLPSGEVLDRQTDREITWDGKRIRLATATARFLVFATPGDPDWFDSGEYFVLHPDDLSPYWRFTLPSQPHRNWLPVGPNEERLITAANGEAPHTVFAIDLVGRAVHELLAPEPGADGRKFQVLHFSGERPEVFQLTLQYYRETPDGNVGEPHLTLDRFRWDGEPLDSHPTEYWAFSNRSPDGRFVLREQVLREVPTTDILEPGEVWTSAVLSGDFSGDLWRLRSVSLSYGDFPPINRWLADSSSFTAAISAEPGASGDVRHAIISTSGFITELLPEPPRAVQVWWQHPWYLVPVPSPTDPDLLAMGRVNLYNRRSGTWLIPNLPADPGPAHADPWALSWNEGNELVFSLPHGGHDGARPPVLIAPHRETAGFPQPPPMRFRVRGTGTCLNFRDAPGLDSAVTACIPDGTSLTLAPKGPRLLGVDWTQDGLWVSTATDSGEHGWVSAAYLAWDA